MLAKDCLDEFKVECDLRRLSARTTKSYYNSTALFLNFLDKPKISSTRKYICPCYGNSVRATKIVNIGCLDCGVQMVLAM